MAEQKPLSVYRVYARDFDSFESLKRVRLQNQDEIHVVLAFARAYDDYGSPTVGKFHPYFKIPDVTPARIAEFKRGSSPSNTVKFFLSIGGRNPNYPFQLAGQANPQDWVNNAVGSIGEILNEYNFDGIDIYYERILNANAEGQFVEAMNNVIQRLRSSDSFPQLQVSITVSAPLSNAYVRLAQVSDYVVYQIHSEVKPIHTPEELVQLIINRATPAYPKQKLLAGHSFLKADWATVPPPVFFGAVADQLLNTCLGISMIVDDDRANQ